MKLDLVVDHPSQAIGSISISSIHWPMEFLQWPFHSPSHMEVDVTDSFPTVNQSSGFSNFSVFCLVKSDCYAKCTKEVLRYC